MGKITSLVNKERYDIVVIAEVLIGYYTMEPIIDQLINEGKKLKLLCGKEVVSWAEKRYGSKIYIEDIAFLTRKYKRLNSIHYAFLRFITKKSFSYQYWLTTTPKGEEKGSFVFSFIYLLSLITPKVAHSKVNKTLSFLFKPFVKVDFGSDKVMVVSRFSLPVILCNHSYFSITTIVESWDHPVKVPVGYVSDKVFVWNEDLKRDWMDYQGDQQVMIGYPFKLRDWFEEGLRSGAVQNQNPNKKILYAASTSSYAKRDNLFASEMFIIDCICKASQKSGYSVYIKPKPNGPKGDFDSLLQKYKHVEVGPYSEVKTISNYYLSREYNLGRKAETQNCEFVLNLGTTFFIDAALMGMPIVQLDLIGSDSLGAMSNSHRNYHIQKYALGKNAFKISSVETIEQDLDAMFSAYKEKANAKGIEIHQWIFPKKTLSEAVSEIVKEALK